MYVGLHGVEIASSPTNIPKPFTLYMHQGCRNRRQEITMPLASPSIPRVQKNRDEQRSPNPLRPNAGAQTASAALNQGVGARVRRLYRTRWVPAPEGTAAAPSGCGHFRHIRETRCGATAKVAPHRVACSRSVNGRNTSLPRESAQSGKEADAPTRFPLCPSGGSQTGPVRHLGWSRWIPLSNCGGRLGDPSQPFSGTRGMLRDRPYSSIARNVDSAVHHPQSHDV